MNKNTIDIGSEDYLRGNGDALAHNSELEYYYLDSDKKMN